jgi:hypothetical protein
MTIGEGTLLTLTSAPVDELIVNDVTAPTTVESLSRDHSVGFPW